MRRSNTFTGIGDLQDGQRGVHDTTEMAPTIGGERAGWMPPPPPRVFSATRKGCPRYCPPACLVAYAAASHRDGCCFIGVVIPANKVGPT